MASEKKIHELIEKQESPDKAVVWNRLQEKLCREDTTDENDALVTVQDGGNTLSLAQRKKALWCMFAGAVVLLVILAVCLTLLKNNEPDTRYCSDDDYTVRETNLTIKEYAASNDLELLFFDWYDETDFKTASIFELNDSVETICIRESMMDMNTGYIVALGFTDSRTEIDFYKSYESYCKNSATVKGVEVQWGVGEFESYSLFEYKGFKYYLGVDDSIEEDLLLSYIDTLLS